ncbi:MAG TPA: methyl-accepting chemotaxis protein [Symbiobacteriaceae bacterium]|nr:methyl-accepting chemotaxis protein [Symbiobacteriaceae bacterium]
MLSLFNLGFIAGIILIAVAGWRLNNRLLRLFNGYRADLAAYRQGRPAPWVDQLVQQYRASQARRGSHPNAQIAVDKFLSGLTVKAVFSNLPILAAERTLRFCGSIPVLLGLTGNFIGWMTALGDLRAAWPQMTADLKPADMVALLDALQEPLSGLSTAFVLSVSGLLVSLVVNAFLYLRNAPAARERFAADLDDFLEHEAATASAPGDVQDLLIHVLQRFGDMAERIEGSVGHMTENVAQVVLRVDTTVATAGELVQRMAPLASTMDRAAGSIEVMASRLEGIVGKMEMASGSFAGGATTLERGLDSFGQGVHRLADAQDRSVALLTDLQAATASTLGLLSDRVQALEQVEGRLADTSAHTVQALQAMIEPVAAAAGQLKEQYSALERQTGSMEISITKLRASGDRLEHAATVMHDTQARFASELEQNLMRANQAQLQQLLDTLNDLNRLMVETQQSYVTAMDRTVGTFVHTLTHPTLEDLVAQLHRLVDQLQAQQRSPSRV